MRQTCLREAYRLAKTDERIFFIGSDLGFGILKEFRQDIPERFIMEGINEAHAVGMAAGLALEGKIVYLNTIATFLTRRCYEQVTLDLCLQNTNVRLIGNGGGLVYAPLGPTHLAIEDIAIFRALPNMTIVAPADADEMRRLMPLTVDYPGPIYIRLAKGYDPIVTNDDQVFEIGRAFPMRTGKDVLIITCGICLRLAQQAASTLSSEGVEAAILHIPTIKPLDSVAVLDMAAPVRAVITVEEHTVIGGLGSAVAETLLETNFDLPKRFKRIGIPDSFPDRYGSQDELLSYCGISPEGIADAARKLLMI